MGVWLVFLFRISYRRHYYCYKVAGLVAGLLSGFPGFPGFGGQFFYSGCAPPG